MTVAVAAPRSRVAADLLAAARLARSRPDLEEEALAQLLYRSWYLRPDPADGAEVLGSPEPAELDAVASYRAAHVLDGIFEPGWTVRRVSRSGRLLVEREGVSRVVARADALPAARRLLPPRPGEEVAVAARRDLTDDAGWWFTFFGAAEAPDQPVRLYWAVRRAAAPALVAALSGLLADGTSAVLKVGASAGHLGRPDAAVLYASPTWATEAVPRLRAIATSLGDGLADRVPRLALPLARGLALAEEPGTGESFGEHRSRLLAAAARRLDSADDEAVLSGLRAALTEAGVDAAAPHRARGSRLLVVR
jgi:hypothetical protein